MFAAMGRLITGVNAMTRCSALFCIALVAALVGCHGARSATPEGFGPADAGSPYGRTSAEPFVSPPNDLLAGYRHGDFLVGSGEVPFVGSVGYLGGPTADSTLVIIALSMPNRALTFTREGERYRAAYDVALELRRQDAPVAREVAHEDVRVANFKETTREQESIIFQQFVVVAPGQAQLSLSIRDAGSTRTATAEARIAVPRLDAGSITPPIAVFRARGRTNRAVRPDLVMSPRATTVFGRDSAAEFYVEAYGARREPLRASIRVLGDGEHTVFADTVTLTRAGDSLRSATYRVPVGRVGFGMLAMTVAEVADSTATPARASARVPLLVAFGEGLAVSSFEQMLGYLRFFTTPERLRALRDAAPEERAHAWAAFLAATDAVPSTVENEALRDYLVRLADANARFREEVLPGWLTDRGMIFTTLGEPDNYEEANNGDALRRTRVLLWEYQRYRARFVFNDQTGFGRWRLTPSSEAEYHVLIRRLRR